MIFKSANIYKYSGAGNTFCLISEKEFEKGQWSSRPEFAKVICSPISGLCADGLVIIKELTDTGLDFSWDFFNSDGSYAEMCGNAARCVGAFCKEILSFPNDRIKILTGAGIISIRYYSPIRIDVEMSSIAKVRPSICYQIEGTNINMSFVNSGVPHLVHEISGPIILSEWKSKAESLRKKTDIVESGCNFTLFSISNCQNESEAPFINAVTFERGVENFTQACGTGAVAAARIAADKLNKNVIHVKMPGGLLSVDFSYDSPLLSGAAILLLQAQVV